MLKKIEQTMLPMKDSAADLLKDPTVLAMLAGGIGTGIAGGALASKVRGREGETKKERRRRILLNALGAAGAGAGVAGLGAAAYRNLRTALPESDVDPATSILVPALRAGGVGAVGTMLHRKGKASESGAQRSALAVLYDKVNNKDWLNGLDQANKGRFSGLKAQLEHVLSNGTPAERADAFNELHKAYRANELSGIPGGAFDDEALARRAGGLASYEVGDPRFWVDKEAWRGWRTKPSELFAGTAPGRLFRRMSGGFGRNPLGYALAGTSLVGAALTPEIVSGAAKAITGYR